MAINHFIPTVWSETLLQSLDQAYIGVKHCNRDFEGDIKEKGAVVKICGVGNITVGNYTKNVDMSAPQQLDDTAFEMYINEAKYFNFQIDDIDQAQCSPKLMSLAMREAANALAKEADTCVYGLFGDARFIFTNEDTTPDNVMDTVLAARTRLLEQGVTDMSTVSLEVSPVIAEMLLKAKVDLSTDNGEVLETGCIGRIAGVRVYVTPNIALEPSIEETYHKCIMRTNRAIAFAEQLSEIDAYRPEKRFADAVKGLHLYGAKVVYPEEMATLDFCVKH